MPKEVIGSPKIRKSPKKTKNRGERVRDNTHTHTQEERAHFIGTEYRFHAWKWDDGNGNSDGDDDDAASIFFMGMWKFSPLQLGLLLGDLQKKKKKGKKFLSLKYSLSHTLILTYIHTNSISITPCSLCKNSTASAFPSQSTKTPPFSPIPLNPLTLLRPPFSVWTVTGTPRPSLLWWPLLFAHCGRSCFLEFPLVCFFCHNACVRIIFSCWKEVWFWSSLWLSLGSPITFWEFWVGSPRW